MIFEQESLYKGRRLRKCSAAARLIYPYLILQSNGYARLELDYDSMADEFASFRDDAPTPERIETFFAEYVKHHLVFKYESNGRTWAQFDTRRSWLKDFKTAPDRKSPNPPEPDYTKWLQEQHGDQWTNFHWNKDVVVPELPDIPATVAKELPKSLRSVGKDLPLGVGVGVGEGVGDVKGKRQHQNLAADAAADVCHISSSGQEKHQEEQLPEWITTNQPLREAWDGFVEMRKKIKHPLTKRATELAVYELEKLRNAGHDPVAVLNRSTLNDWRGLFPLDKPVTKTRANGKMRHIEITAIDHTTGHEKRSDGSLIF